MAEKNWRYKYNKYLLQHVQTSLKSPESALAAANAGLQELHNTFEFVRDGQTMKFSDAMRSFKGSFQTGFLKGMLDGYIYIVTFPYIVLYKNSSFLS